MVKDLLSRQSVVYRMFSIVVILGFAGLWPMSATSAFAANTAAPATCQLNSLNGQVKHVIEIQFDNTHFVRDNPNVPSDLEQMPHLLNFIESNGTLLANHHTPLISHTGTDLLTVQTGLYGNRHGVPVSNSFRYFNPNGTSNTGVAFTYWTAPIFDPTTSTPTDTKFNMLGLDNKNTPAPWVPFTRAGCNVGVVATANMVLENNGVDIATVFGSTSPENAEALANPSLATTDFVGIGIHCAQNDLLCSTANNGRPDLLPDEPGGYSGFNGLFGHKYVAPQISPSGPLTDLNGNVIQDSLARPGFPGFDGMAATVSLSYVAAMQEHGVPVTYAYISDAHDNHATGTAFGPGQAGYVAALKAYDDAFAKFFTRLGKDGINASNTLFIITADENDHFVGGAPSPAGCDGVNIPCTYSQIGELNANLAGLLATQQGITTPFRVHSDSAPTVYITGNPARDAAVTRAFERASGKLTAVNPMTGATDQLTQFMADPVEMQILHMVTADPARTPTFVLFANPDYFLFAGAANCNSPCVTQQPGFAWNHGDVQSEITTTWAGLVGPGVKNEGVDTEVWTDHTDLRPTLLMLTGLKDDYVSDGRAITEIVKGGYVPPTARGGDFMHLAQAYKEINATVGPFGLASLSSSTLGLKSSAANDADYTSIEGKLANLGAQRDALAAKMIALLNGAAFNNQPIPHAQFKTLMSEADDLLHQVNALPH